MISWDYLMGNQLTPSLNHSSIVLCVFLVPHSAMGQPAEPVPKITRLPHEGYRTSVAFAPDGKTLATGGNDNHIRLWDVATAQQKLAISAHSAPAGVSRVAFFPDGKTLASGSWSGDGTVKIWEVATGKHLQTVDNDLGGICFVAPSPDGKYLAWGNGGKIHLYDVSKGREARRLSMNSAVDSVAFSHDSIFLATANGDATVRLWEVATGKPIRDIPARQTTATGSQAVAFSHDGATIATASGKVRLWNVARGAELAALGPAHDIAFCVATSADGRFLASGTNSSLHVWDMKSQKEIHSWNKPAVSLAFSPDGNWLAFGSRDGRGGASIVRIGAPAK